LALIRRLPLFGPGLWHLPAEDSNPATSAAGASARMAGPAYNLVVLLILPAREMGAALGVDAISARRALLHRPLRTAFDSLAPAR
jgi:hypothetical protein